MLICAATPLPAQEVWVGGANPDPNWSNAANWQDGSAPLSNQDLHFQGNNQTTNNNDYGPTGYSIASLTFDSGAPTFTLQGNPIIFFNAGSANSITNNSTSTQILEFTDSGNFRGVTIAADHDLTIDAAAGDFNIRSNVGLLNFSNLGGNLIVTGAHTTTIAGMIVDDVGLRASLTKNGTGTLILTNDNTYRNGTIINSGTLVVGSANALGMQDPFFFAPRNEVHLNGGTLQTDTPRTFNIPRDYFQTAGTLRLQIGSAVTGVNNDLMQVSGAANLGGQLFIHQFGGFIPANGDRVTVITAVDGVNGTFASVMDDFPGLIQAMADYSIPNQVDIVFSIGSFVFSGLTPNQEDVAQELNEVANDSRATELVNFLVSEPLANLPRDYDLIAPEEFAAIYEIGFSQTVVQNNNLQRRMDDIRAGSNGYCGPIVEAPRMDAKDYNPPIQDKNVVTQDKNVASPVTPCPENRWGVFVTGTGDFASVGHEDSNAGGYDVQTGGVTVGVDYRLGNHFAVGIDGNYASSTADLVNDGRVSVDGGKIGGYATLFGNGLWGSKLHLDGAVNGGWNSYDTRRTGLEDLPVRGSTNGAEFNALLAYGADWALGCFNIGTWSTLQYTNVQIDSFTEEGSLAPLEIQNQDEDSLRATTGLRASYDLKFGRCSIFRPEIRAAYQHEYGNPSYAIDARFASGAGDVFRVHGPTIGRDSALVGAGFNMQWCARFSTYVYYDGVLGRSNYDNNAVSGGIRFGF